MIGDLTYSEPITEVRGRQKNKYLYDRLAAWGEWRIDPVRGIGYKTRTVEAMLMEMGGSFGSGNSPEGIIPNYSPHPRCAHVERIWSEMPDKEWQKAILIQYIIHPKWHEIKSITGWGRAKYEHILEMAHLYMSMRLNYQWEA